MMCCCVEPSLFCCVEPALFCCVEPVLCCVEPALRVAPALTPGPACVAERLGLRASDGGAAVDELTLPWDPLADSADAMTACTAAEGRLTGWRRGDGDGDGGVTRKERFSVYAASQLQGSLVSLRPQAMLSTAARRLV